MRALHVLALISLVATTGCDNTAEPGAPPALTTVGIAPAFTGPAAPPIRTTGLVENRDEMRLSFKVAGVIRSVSVSEGERVRQGQRLAEIERTEVNAQVEQARQMAEKAQRDVARGERLYADKVISLEQLEDMRTQAAVARASLASAEFNSGYAAIVAPRDGTVLRRLAEEREFIAAGAPVLVLGAADRGYVVRAGLADREIVQVQLNDHAEVRVDAHPQAVLSGRVIERGSAADPASGLFPIEIALDATSLSMASGLVARITLSPASASEGERVYVPVAAIVEGDGKRASVFVLDGDRARRREVEVAFIDGTGVALTSGLQAGESVVTDGALYIEDGERVQPQRTAVAQSR
jgi:multidrug efflux system membrane fusion protein